LLQTRTHARARTHTHAHTHKRNEAQPVIGAEREDGVSIRGGRSFYSAESVFEMVDGVSI
jgi:hypothetical protein